MLLVSPVEFAKLYGAGRKINEKNPQMSRHIQFEGMMTMTGACADERYHHKPSETGAIALALYAALGGTGVTAPALNETLNKGIAKTVQVLQANRGGGLVISGSNDVNVQIIVNAINNLIGANGSTIDWSSTYNVRQGIDADMVRLVEDMNRGAIGGLFIYGANPVYTYPDSKRFVDGLKRVKFSVSFNQKMDETTELCKYVIPDHHYLESWGDAEPKTGNVSLLQPTINPLFKTRQWQDSLLKWSGSPVDYLAFYKQYWSTKLGGEFNWDKALQDEVINGGVSRNTILTTPTSGNPDTAKSVNFTGTVLSGLSGGGKATSSPFNAASVSQAATALASIKKGGAYELVLYEKVTIGSGQQGIPWLQETPDPITKATWDNYVIISPATAKKLF